MKKMFQYPFLGILAASALYGQHIPAKLSFSGTGGASAANLHVPNTVTGEEDVAGAGTLGIFSFRNITAQTAGSATVHYLLGPQHAVSFSCGRRRHISIRGREFVDRQAHPGR